MHRRSGQCRSVGQLGAGKELSVDALRGVAMPDVTMRPDPDAADLTNSRPETAGAVQQPRAEDEGLSVREIKWIPVVVPLAALTMLLGAAAVLSTA